MMQRWRNFFSKTNHAADMPQDQPPAAFADTVWSESLLYRHADFEKWNPDDLIGRKGHAIYKKMMRDEQVKAVVKFKRGAITSRGHFFEFDDEAKEMLSEDEQAFRLQLFEKVVNNIDGCFKDGLNAVMCAQWQGYSMTEIVPKFIEFKGRNWLGVHSLVGKPFDTFRFNTDAYGNIVSVTQELDGKKQTIDTRRVIHFVHNMEMEQHYGQSDLREAYRSWFSKDASIKFQNIYLERMAGGFVTLSVDASGLNGDPPVVTPGTAAHAQIMETLRSINTMSGILVPAGFRMDVHNPASTDVFEKSIVLHDLQIAKALLVPNLLGLSHAGQTGSFAQSQTQLEAFLWTLDSEAERLVDTMNEQFFRTIGEANFGDDHWPRYKMHPLSEQRKLLIIEKWAALVGASAVTPSDTDEGHLRELLGFPEVGDRLQSPNPAPAFPAADGSPGHDDEDGPLPLNPEEQDETIMSRRYRRICLRRAMKRVRINVIQKSMDKIDTDGADLLESVFADVAAQVFARVEDEKLGTPAQDNKAFEKFDTTPAQKRKMQAAARKILEKGWASGQKFAQGEIDTAKKERFARWDMARLDEESAAYFAAKSFTIAGKLAGDMVAIIRNNLEQGLKFSWTTAEIIRKSYAQMVRRGYLKAQTMQNALAMTLEDVEELLQETFNIHHMRTIVRTNTTEAINEARFASFTDPALGDFVEAMEYSAILDSRVTKICEHLDGRQYASNDSTWNTYRPPNHFNCRSLLIPITTEDTWEPSGAPSIQPQAGFGGTI